MLALRLFRYACFIAAVVAIPFFAGENLPVDHWCWQLCGSADGARGLHISAAFVSLGFLIWGLEKLAVARARVPRGSQVLLVLAALPAGLLLHRMLDAYFFASARIFDPVGRAVNQLTAQFGGNANPFRRWSPDILFNFKDYFRLQDDFYGVLGWGLALSVAFFAWARSCAAPPDDQAPAPDTKMPFTVLAIVLLGAGGTLFALARSQQPLIELRTRCQDLIDAYDTAHAAFTSGEIELGRITEAIDDRLTALNNRSCPWRLSGSLQTGRLAAAIRDRDNLQAVVSAVLDGRGTLEQADRLYDEYAPGWPVQAAWQRERGKVIVTLIREGDELDLSALLGSVTILVETFQNLSTGAEHAQVAEQFTAELRGRLASIDGLAAAQPHGLDVSHILKGSVRASGDRVRIAAILVTSDTGLRVWSRSFDRPLDAAPEIQREVADGVLQTLLTVQR